MHTFKLISETLNACLTNKAFTRCVDYQNRLWPELQARIDHLDSDSLKRKHKKYNEIRAGLGVDSNNENQGDEYQKLDLANFPYTPAVPERHDQDGSASDRDELRRDVLRIVDERLEPVHNQLK